MLETLSQCPVCSSKNYSETNSVIDHAVSQERFHLCKCDHCSLIFTNPRPDFDSIAPYYDFEEYYSHSDQSNGLIAKIYQKVKAVSIKRKIKQLHTLSPKGYLLDYGCGTGELIHQAAHQGWTVNGIEPNTKARQSASNKLPGKIFESIDVLQKDKQFDLITLYHVLEHIHNLNETVTKLLGQLKHTGHLVIAVPNPESHDAIYYKDFWAGWDVPRHLYHFTETSIQEFAKIHGLKMVQNIPLPFDSFYVSLLSENYKNPNSFKPFNYVRALNNGLISNIKASKASKANYSSNIFIFKKS